MRGPISLKFKSAKGVQGRRSPYAARVRELFQAGMKLADIARAIPCTPHCVSQIVNGKRGAPPPAKKGADCVTPTTSTAPPPTLTLIPAPTTTSTPITSLSPCSASTCPLVSVDLPRPIGPMSRSIEISVHRHTPVAAAPVLPEVAPTGVSLDWVDLVGDLPPASFGALWAHLLLQPGGRTGHDRRGNAWVQGGGVRLGLVWGRVRIQLHPRSLVGVDLARFVPGLLGWKVRRCDLAVDFAGLALWQVAPVLAGARKVRHWVNPGGRQGRHEGSRRTRLLCSYDRPDGSGLRLEERRRDLGVAGGLAVGAGWFTGVAVGPVWGDRSLQAAGGASRQLGAGWGGAGCSVVGRVGDLAARAAAAFPGLWRGIFVGLGFSFDERGRAVREGL